VTRVAGLVLAAGEGRRFGGPKAPFVLDGSRLVDRAVAVLRDAGCDPVIVVLGAWVGVVPDAQVIVNDSWSEGIGSSLRTGLAALQRLEVDRVLVTLVDLVGLTSEAVVRVIESQSELAAATYRGERRHPVLLGRIHWPGVCASAVGDVGARPYLDANSDLVTLVEVGDVASDEDLDLPRRP
jgi:CTP:molybdopterin cytidylyltransferase MocA